MAGGLATERAKQYQGKVTSSVIVASIVASLVGLIFGYAAILGQITWQDIFYDTFIFDSSDKNPRQYDYCKYSNRYDFELYGGGPLYLAGALSSLLSYPLTRKYGRRMSIILAGVILFIGSAAGVYPAGLVIVLVNQIVLGFGLGFGIQVALLYLSEIAPAHFRGGLNIMFQVAIAIGILVGNMVRNNLNREETLKIWLFFLAFALPTVPALLIIVGGITLVPETPNSLVERGSVEKGREVLAKIRGTQDIDAEFQDIVDASEFAKATQQNHFLAIKNIFRKRNCPQLVMAILLPIFANLTGVVFIFIYAPLLFWSLGSRFSSALYSTAINGSVLVFSALVSMAIVDKVGRRVLLVSGGVIMVISQVIIAIMLGSNLGDKITKNELSIFVTVLIGIFVLAYGWSWGPLGWTIPSEIFTLETRSVGQSIAVAINLLFAYVVLQFFIPLLCAFKYGLFLFFAGWIAVMTVFVCLFLPETKGVPIEEMAFLWTKHWFWKRIVGEDSQALHETPENPPPKHV